MGVAAFQRELDWDRERPAREYEHYMDRGHLARINQEKRCARRAQSSWTAEILPAK